MISSEAFEQRLEEFYDGVDADDEFKHNLPHYTADKIGKTLGARIRATGIGYATDLSTVISRTTGLPLQPVTSIDSGGEAIDTQSGICTRVSLHRSCLEDGEEVTNTTLMQTRLVGGEERKLVLTLNTTAGSDPRYGGNTSLCNRKSWELYWLPMTADNAIQTHRTLSRAATVTVRALTSGDFISDEKESPIQL